MPLSPCDKLEASLERAVRRFAKDRAAERRRRDGGRDLRFLFARLGLSFADLDALSFAGGGSDISPALRSSVRGRLDAERRRLVRLARSGSALYDAGRHLAVRAAIGWLEDAAGASCEADADLRLPGTVLNARFRRRGPRPVSGPREAVPA